MGTNNLDLGLEERRLIAKFLNNTSKLGISKITTKSKEGDIIFTKLKNLRKKVTHINKADSVREFINSLPIGSSLTIDDLIKKYTEATGDSIVYEVMGKYLRNLTHIGIMDSKVGEKREGTHGGSTPKIYIKQYQIDKQNLKQMVGIISKPSKLKGKRGRPKKYEAVKDDLKKILDKEGIDLTKKLKWGLRKELADRLNVTDQVIGKKMEELRIKGGMEVENQKAIIPQLQDRVIQEHLLKNNLLRGSNKEVIACKKIIDIIQNTIPKGGAAMMIGTPGPFFACAKSLSNKIVIDNLAINIHLDGTTDKPVIVIVGNAVSQQKAELKASQWKSINYPNDLDVEVDRVDRDGFTMHVTAFVEKNKGSICKVVLLTSGIWGFSKNTKKKFNKAGVHGNFNFKDPSKRLTSKYRNLHILAITMDNGVAFDVRYLHDNKEEIFRL